MLMLQFFQTRINVGLVGFFVIQMLDFLDGNVKHVPVLLEILFNEPNGRGCEVQEVKNRIRFDIA